MVEATPPAEAAATREAVVATRAAAVAATRAAVAAAAATTSARGTGKTFWSLSLSFMTA